MRVLSHRVAGDEATIRVAERAEEVGEFYGWAERQGELAYDVETTGLDIYSGDFRVRLAQFGTRHEAWVLPVESGAEFGEAARRVVSRHPALVAHNAPYDILAAHKEWGTGIEGVFTRMTDTRTLSHLTDSRSLKDGGPTGHALEDLAEHYVCPDARQAERDLKAEFKRLRLLTDGELITVDQLGALRHEERAAKVPMAERRSVGARSLNVGQAFARIPIASDVYVRYAGADVLNAAGLVGQLRPRVPGSARHLVEFERDVAMVCAILQDRGLLIDMEYTRRLSSRLAEEAEHWEAKARALGVDNIHAGQQVADMLQRRGVDIPGRTKTGLLQVDKILLGQLVALGDPLAIAVQRARRAHKWNSTYATRFLEMADGASRVHPGINSLAARTARMSIQDPGLQILPSEDSMIRHCVQAEPGEVIWSVDYSAQELRMLALLATERVIERAFRDGSDLHMMTARSAFGENAGPEQRKIGKMANFLTIYGGGAKALASQAGIDEETARHVIDSLMRTYPGIKAYAKRREGEARRLGHITTRTGRRLHVDRARAYSAVNYDIQSASRDVTAGALVRAHRAGMTDYIRLPIHDELVGSAPEKDAHLIAWEMGQIMTETIQGIEFTTDPEVGGRSWGSLYQDTPFTAELRTGSH
ncbi:hypothetical protein Lfu02_55200 [Longispora fulva]|uniref:DNA polymerase I n=1 Tax=Longispora fulva TaxID=619741 RepID=A0A8J7GEX5_9ACTN|nr:DNA polymerase [Longispora fulva]MBG6137499.1 DNA polymerase-1 [Longispora fulva]GIG61148.1 hypothetical protein Lfu02_55200 [Longispora fulva]